MKNYLTLFPVSLSVLCLSLAFGSVILWMPTNLEAAIVWNLAIMMAPALALLAEWQMARERQFQLTTVVTLIAIVNTSIVLGSRLGAWSGADWVRALGGQGLPDLPGKTVMGGLVLAILVYIALKRLWKLPAALADVLAIGLPLAAVSGRVGCLVAGCCYGIPTNSNWGISYGPGTPAYEHQVAAGILHEGAASTTFLYPIQLILIGGNFLIFLIMWGLRNKVSRPGALAFLGLGLLTFQRFGIEFFRDVATNRGSFGVMLGGLKTGQWVMLAIALCSLAGFAWLYFTQPVNKRPDQPTQLPVGTAPQAYVLGGIILGGFLLRDVLTLDEAMVILISCLPAMVLLGRSLWRDYHAGRTVFAPASLLSISAILLIANPIDTIPAKPSSMEWKRWVDVGAGATLGNYEDISRDCDGNVVERYKVNTRSGGGEVNANWQRGFTRLRVGVRGAFGVVSTDENIYTDNNYRYSALGLQTEASGKFMGLSIGLYHLHQSFPAKVGNDVFPTNQFLPSGTLRIGRADRYSVDFRLYDEPGLGLVAEPPFSMGLINWGFNDLSGQSLVRAGFAVTSASESSLHLFGRFPIGKTGLSGNVTFYLGNATMFNAGLRYRFKEK
ncbi:MAG TPA: prolipoprotein diacylglyceryl transferase family protein [Saprospiraceae bacterium]|nr:prolipoprotein diacylglyceryl transferase family protein [Saprospiraceae bacterium]